ncbi:hypothetical protein CEXT_406001 [Caerostris extrusa]|uniref:Uncharacterized protein n=1 Tax=Caerostris extrusa TaxID=172846 RepID=A0AAV4NTX7_CAEEX|nr:hypothetical protein CEXT_406001 [Caerostris extrusa]
MKANVKRHFSPFQRISLLHFPFQHKELCHLLFDKDITEFQNLEHFTTKKTTTKPHASRLYAQNGSYRDWWKSIREKCHNNPQIRF